MMTDDQNHVLSVFEQLKDLLTPYYAGLEIHQDKEDSILLSTRFIMKNNQPLFFAAIQKKAHHVSFHLMPVYVEPILMLDVTPELKRRMEGKSGFIFESLTPELVSQLSRLVELGYRSFQQQGYVEQSPNLRLQ